MFVGDFLLSLIFLLQQYLFIISAFIQVFINLSRLAIYYSAFEDLFALYVIFPYLCKKLHMEKELNYTQIVDLLLEHGPFKDKKHAVTLIARTLGVSHTSVYNKLGDRCRFSLEEFTGICHKFKLSPNVLLTPTGTHSNHFTSRHLSTDPPRPSLISQWINISETWCVPGLQQPSIIRIFPQTFLIHHLSLFPYLLYLSLYYNQTMPSASYPQTEGFEPEIFIQNHATKLANQRMIQNFLHSSVMELLHPSMLDGILTAYFELTATGDIDRDIYHKHIAVELSELIEYLESVAANSKITSESKYNSQRHHHALCPFAGTSDWVLYQTPDNTHYSRFFFGLGQGTESKDAFLYQQLLHSFDKKWQESIPISGAGAIARKTFFKQVKHKVLNSITKVTSALPHQEAYGQTGHQVPDNIHAREVPYRSPSP